MKNTEKEASLRNKLFEKFKEFEITNTEANKVKGGIGPFEPIDISIAAPTAADQLGASSIAVGSSILIQSGESSEVSHELVHVAQQQGGRR